MPFLSIVGRSTRPPAGSGGGGGGGGGDWEAGTFDNGAALPQTKLTTTFNLAAQTGPVHTVSTASALATALTDSASQDHPRIVITANIDTSSGFTLPARTGAGWCYIISNKVHLGTFGKAPGKRVAATDAGDMFRLRSTSNNTPVISALTGATHANKYRIVGLEFDTTATQDGGLIELGSKVSNASHHPTEIVIDRCYVHGNPGVVDVRRGIALHAPSSAVIDSCITGITYSAFECQAVACNYSAGPFKIVNNRLQAAGENFMSGGDNCSFTPSDIEFRFNYCDVDPNWEGVYGGIKNNFELKIVKRMLIEGNYFRYMWVAGQTGNGIVFKVTDQDGGNGSQYVTEDVVFRHNWIRDYVEPFRMIATQRGTATSLQVMTRFTIRNNVWNTSRGDANKNYILGSADGGPIDLKMMNNVIEGGGLYYHGACDENTGTAGTGFVFRDNIVSTGTTPDWTGGPFGKSGGGGTSQAIANVFTGYTFNKNAVRGTWTSDTIADNTTSTATTFRNIFTNYNSNDFSVAGGNWAKGVGTGGADPGIDQTTWSSTLQYTEDGQRPSEI